jgi:hypothetical protein
MLSSIAEAWQFDKFDAASDAVSCGHRSATSAPCHVAGACSGVRVLRLASAITHYINIYVSMFIIFVSPFFDIHAL